MAVLLHEYESIKGEIMNENPTLPRNVRLIATIVTTNGEGFYNPNHLIFMK